MKKKVLSLFIAFIFLISLIPSNIVLAAENDTYTDDIFTYTELADGTLSVTKYEGSGGAVTIPSEYDPGTGAIAVSAIGGNAFASKTITSITIPDSITTIGASAFKGCSSLVEVTIPDSVITLGDSAFYGCGNLGSVTLGSSLTSIGAYAFEFCDVLEEIVIPDSVTSIGEYVFCFCDSLAYVTLGSGMTTVAKGIFKGCSALKLIDIPEGYTAIDEWAFGDCENLRNITLPSTLTRIGTSAFAGCTSLTNIALPDGLEIIDFGAFQNSGLMTVLIPDNVTTVDRYTFYNCSSLSYVKLPSSQTSIGSSMFEKCTSLTGITLPAGVTTIGSSAFRDSALTEITLPSGVTSIGGYAFSGCSSLTDITIPSGVTTIADNTFENCTSLKDITLPNSVTSIGSYAFSGCTSLAEFTIPDNVTTIHFYTFSDCSSLASVTIPSGVTSIFQYAFENCAELKEVTIPAAVTTLSWKVFSGCSMLRKATILNKSSYFTIYNDTFENTDLAADGIYGFSGSYAKTYAARSSIPFHYLYTVSFDTAGGSTVDNQIIVEGESLAQPTDPEKSSWDFEGWFKDTAYTQPVSFPHTVSGDATLYAKWYCAVQSVSLDQSSINMTHHDTAVLTATVLPVDATYPEVTWASSDESVATVNSVGVVEAVGVGDATITATADGISDTCTVTVAKKPVTSVTLSQETLSMVHHDTETLTVTVLPGNATYPEVIWTSDDESVATVDLNGVVTAAGVGSAIITATADGISDTCEVTVTKKPVTSVTLDKDTLSIIHHDTAELTATVLPGNATYPEVTWTSDNVSVATVDTNGVVTAVSLGSATITATADGISDTCEVTVTKKPVTSVTLNANTSDMIHHDTMTLTAEVLPSNATYTDITWTSSDESVATVNSEGVVEAVGVGEAIITATADGVSDTCEVTVAKKPITSVTLSADTLDMEHHDTVILTVVVLPVDATYPEVTWESSDESVATVSSAGVVEAVGVGEATITATADGISDTCAVTVAKKPVTSVTLSADTLDMIHHDTQTLTVTVLPSNATYADVTWTSDDDSVATVDANGVVTAVGLGSATITATADGISDTCTVTVAKKPVTSVTLSKETLSMVHHDKATLTATVLPGNATYPEVTWTSDNESVATVDLNGVVTATGVGSVTITATAGGISDTCEVTVTKKSVTSVTLDKDTLSIIHHDTQALTATVLPADATYPEVTWTSDNESVATVDSNGVVTAVSLGSATITATADGISDTCEVTVTKKPVTSVMLNANTLDMIHHDTMTLTAEVLPSNATYTDITWISSDKSVATVNSEGVVEAVGVGDAIITAMADGVFDTCEVTVAKKPVTSVTLSKDTLEMIHHDTTTLTATVLPVDATYTDVTWISSNESVATVNSAGIVEAVGVGEAIITVAADDISDTCEVTVAKKPVDSVTLSEEMLTMLHHDTGVLTTEVLPLNASYTEVTWGSSDDTVVTVDQNGNIEAVGLGSAVITATADGVSDTCAITVNKRPVNSVTLSKNVLTMEQHDTAVLTAEVLPSNATYPEVTWESSDAAVVTVDQSGNIEAMGLGNAVITATADGISDTCNITVNKKPVASIILSEESLTMEHHDSEVLIAEVLPGNATYPDVIWESSDDTIVSVDQNGNIEAISLGCATIIAIADDVSDTCEVTVNKKPVSIVTLNSSDETVFVGDVVTLAADVLPINATYPEITWESSDETVATVDENGVVTTIKGGRVTITATADSVSADCNIFVVQPVTLITLSSSSKTMIHHDTLTLLAEVLPDDVTYPDVTWTTSNKNVATVDQGGKVTAVEVGSAKITATADGVSEICSITVNKNPVTDVTMNENELSLVHHDTVLLTASVMPSNATYPQITWVSSDSSVVTIDELGSVLAVGIGSAEITATADEVTTVCDVTVNKNPVTSVVLNETSITLITDGIFKLIASVVPNNATYPKIAWESSNPSVVEVDDSGIVTAISTGSAVVTAEADGIASICEVTVQPKSDKTVTITGVLTDENGKPLIGKIVELHSDPMSTVTDKEGRFTFENVYVEHHTLIIMDTAGDPLKEFEIDLNTEEEFTWEEDENTCVNIMLSKDTASIKLSISLNDEDFGIIGVQDVTYPIETPGSIWKYIVIATALLLAVLVGIYAVLKIKRRSTY